MGFLRWSSGGGELLGSGSVVGRNCPRHSVAATIKLFFCEQLHGPLPERLLLGADTSIIEKAVSDERERERENMAG